MTDQSPVAALTDEEIEALLASGDEVLEQRRLKDLEDVRQATDVVGYVNFTNEDWVMVAAFSELVARNEVRRMITIGGSKVHTDGVDLYNGFAMHCSAACSGVMMSDDVKSFFEAVIYHYSHMKPLDDVHATFKKAMEPLFDFLVDAFRESQHDRLVVASMESVWNKKFSLSLAYDVVSTRSVD